MAVKSSTLNFGMVSAPCRLEKIEDRRDVGFQLGAPGTEHGVDQVYVDHVTGEVVGPRNLCAHGILTSPADKTGFVEVPEEAIKAIDESCEIDGITIDKFVPADDVPRERFLSAYYVAPGKGAGPAGVKPLVLLREMLEQGEVAGIGKLSMRPKQRPFVVYAKNGGLMLNVLSFAEDFAPKFEKAQEALAGVEADPKHVQMALTLVESMKVEASALDEYTDDSRELRAELVAKAVAGEKIDAPEKVVEQAATTNLEDALLASIGAAAPTVPAKKKVAKKEKVTA